MRPWTSAVEAGWPSVAPVIRAPGDRTGGRGGQSGRSEPVFGRRATEVVEGDTAGYHYYPGRERVMGWFAGRGLTLVQEGVSDHDGWWYRP